jgi:hypothetical protein
MSDKDLQPLKIIGNIPAQPTPEDEQGYIPEKPSFVFVSIRQKQLLTEEGEVLKKAGQFKFSDDRPDEKPLKGVIICTQKGRVYFPSPGALSPECKSIDGITGINGKKCLECEKSYWIKGQKPDCFELRNILFLSAKDKISEDSEPLILTIHGASLSAKIKNPPQNKDFFTWREYLTILKKNKPPIPLHYVVTQIGTYFQKDPQPHFITVFKPDRFLIKDELNFVKKVREDLLKILIADFEKATEELKIDEEKVEETYDSSCPF